MLAIFVHTNILNRRIHLTVELSQVLPDLALAHHYFFRTAAGIAQLESLPSTHCDMIDATDARGLRHVRYRQDLRTAQGIDECRFSYIARKTYTSSTG